MALDQPQPAITITDLGITFPGPAAPITALNGFSGQVADGQMVAVGSVDELRSSGAAQLVIEAPQAAPDWTAALPGVRLVSHRGGETVVELDQGTDDQTVLRAALATGPVRSFGYRRPSLTELFRHVVSQETPHE